MLKSVMKNVMRPFKSAESEFYDINKGGLKDLTFNSIDEEDIMSSPTLERNAWTASKDALDAQSPCPDCLENQRRSSFTSSTVDGSTDKVSEKSNMPGPFDERRGSSSNSSGRGFTRLARRLSQKEKKGQNTETPKSQTNTRHQRQRSVSLDWPENEEESAPSGDGRRVNLLNQLNSKQNEGTTLGTGLLISTSPSMPGMRIGGAISPNRKGRRRASVDVGGSMTYMMPPENKRKGERKSLSEVQALFEAVENQDIEAVRHLVLNQKVDMNCRNENDFSPLDIAILTNNIPVAKFLLCHGAQENQSYEDESFITSKLTTAINCAARNIVDLMANIMNSASGRATLSAGQLREHERLLPYWEFRHRLLKRMKMGYSEAGPPDSPVNVQLTVAGSSSFLVNFTEPKHNGAVVTRYRVEWSKSIDFQPYSEHLDFQDTSVQAKVTLTGLTLGQRYYVRVKAYNIKGSSPYAASDPPYAVPSSWREVENTPSRTSGRRKMLDVLFSNIRNARPAEASEIRDSTQTDSPGNTRKIVKKGIKNLFTAPKFLKSLKRGIYMTCLLYNEDRVVVTEENILPVVEVDENFTGSNLYTDFHWMMKVACTWEDVKLLRQDMERNSSSSTVHFRCKLLQAAAQLQNGLGIQDLGQFYYKPVKDGNGTVILAIVQHIRDSKIVSSSGTKWTQIGKLQKRLVTEPGNENSSALDHIVSNIQDFIHYNQSSYASMDSGLYLGYLKLRSSVDLIQLLVPHNMPNILPHVKIRDCPNVSKEEWSWLQSLGSNEVKQSPSVAQQNFQRLLVNKCDELLVKLNYSEDECVSHRIYDLEVIELSPTVSFLLLLPPVEQVCSVPGHNDQLSDMTEYLPLPVQVFEMIHMSTYQREFISLYSRLSSILEVDQQLAQQSLREAFCSEEVATSKDRLEQVQTFQQTLDEAWRGVRWTMDIITYGRDKTARRGLPLGILYAPPPSPECSPEMYRKDMDHVVSSASDLGYHSDINSMTDISWDASSNSNFLTPNYGNPSRQRAHSDMSLDNVSDFNDVTVTSGYNSQTSIEDTSTTSIPGVLRVYAAYNTALAKGTSVKLHVTPRTTCREVVQLVVQQLNRATRMKNLQGPYYCDEQMDDFCLVAVIGARERVLRPDYQPLQLQNPWTKGRLFVRMRTDLLAALDQGQVSMV